MSKGTLIHAVSAGDRNIFTSLTAVAPGDHLLIDGGKENQEIVVVESVRQIAFSELQISFLNLCELSSS